MLENLKLQFSRWRKAVDLAPHIDDLHAAFEEREGGALNHQERELLENAIAFSETTADEVGMTRSDIVSIPETADFMEIIKIFQESYHSRLPVTGRDLDDVKGLVSLKDVMALVGREEQFDMTKLIRPATFVPESMVLQRVLHVMKRTRMPLVLVSNEFGGTSGLITLKDILEELFGDIEDEHEDEKEPAFVSLGQNRYRVQGDYALEELDHQLHLDLNEHFENVETIGGAVLQVANRVPARGESFMLDARVQATVAASDERRVLAVDLKIKA